MKFPENEGLRAEGDRRAQEALADIKPGTERLVIGSIEVYPVLTLEPVNEFTDLRYDTVCEVPFDLIERCDKATREWKSTQAELSNILRAAGGDGLW